ncbi:MAG TPA: FUSC family protein, partial [Acidimicrobiales bacterium]|nr:FUSC family protein [Acidimicrobiales bacterium]
ASPGTLSMIPSRLEGWWLATAAGTLAVLVLSPRPESDRLRLAASDTAGALAVALEVGLSGRDPKSEADAAFEAKHQMVVVFDSTPFRPTGLARADQALDDLVESLQWSSLLVVDVGRERADIGDASDVNKELFGLSAQALRHIAALLRGDRTEFDLTRFDKPLEEGAAEVAALGTDGRCGEGDVHLSFHARMVASAVRAALIQAQIACGVAERADAIGLPASLRAGANRAMGHASLRSAWTLNSIRGAVALAAAIATADLVHVQHGFWVVLGTLSVLRTNAASTGSTALRAIAGTAAGFFIGGGLIIAIGAHTSALWIALPIAVFIASYAPGTAPFAVGQAAFTVTISVLYNILVPVGWKVGVVRIEDVAIGAAVSAVVGILFWPRGANAIVADDLADSFHIGGVYLVQATSWAVGSRSTLPDAAARTVAASLRLDDALRGFINEQGSKHVPKEMVWRLIGTTLRLRLTSQSLASLPPPDVSDDPARHSLVGEAVLLAERCDAIARQLRMTPDGTTQDVIPAFSDDPGPVRPEAGYLLWVREHLDHVRERFADLVEPIEAVAARKSVPWWR